MIAKELRASIAASLGANVRSVVSKSGGNVADAFVVTLDDEERVFVKTSRDALAADMLTTEARGLEWLRAAHAVTVPRVRGVSRGEDGAPAWLALELILGESKARDHDERLGRELAALHRSKAPCFGLAWNNFIGRVPQDNSAHVEWASFYRDRRIEPLVQRTHAAGTLPAKTRMRFDALSGRLPELVGPSEPAARLHGDLWAGNAIVGSAGEPVLVDPAVYGGHREMDLAMMRLFGGFSPRVFAAYDEAFPLAPEADARVPLYQLYYLLVHLAMFGASYLPGVERALAECA